jgi:hypothetical protein
MTITKDSFAKRFYIKIGKLALINICAAIGMYLLTLFTTFFDTHKFLARASREGSLRSSRSALTNRVTPKRRDIMREI